MYSSVLYQTNMAWHKIFTAQLVSAVVVICRQWFTMTKACAPLVSNVGVQADKV